MSDTPPEIPKKFPMRAHLRKYGAFTPAGINEAIEAARQLPIPKDPAILARLGHQANHNVYRKTVDLPGGVAWRLLKLADARGITVNKILREIVTYYIMAVSEAAIDGVPALYADFTTPEGTAVLAQALQKALGNLLPQNISSIGELIDAANEIPEEELVRPTPSVRTKKEKPPAAPPPPEEEEREEFQSW